MAFDGRLLSGVSVLAAIVESGSFVRAADALGLTASGVSRALARLESRVGVRLIERTTRAMQLTDEGKRFYEQVAPLLSGIEEAASVASGARAAVRGRLRVNIDPHFSRMLLADQLARFIERYPELSLELILREQVGDLVADGCDVAVRFGEPTSQSLIARKLLDTRVLTVASPRYLARRGRPATVTDLPQHECIQFRDFHTGKPFEWEFHQNDRVVPVATQGRLLLSDAATMLGACIAGAGIAQILALGTQPLLDRGDLVELFPDWPGEVFPLYAFYPRRNPSAKVRAFIDFCVETIR
jgi:DNA-binding transcriptional LysR family regulator